MSNEFASLIEIAAGLNARVAIHYGAAPARADGSVHPWSVQLIWSEGNFYASAPTLDDALTGLLDQMEAAYPPNETTQEPA